MRKIKKGLFTLWVIVFLASVFAMPGLALAQPGGYVDPASGINTVTGEQNFCVFLEGVEKVLCQIQRIVNSAIPVAITLGVVYFVWGVVQYMIGGGDEAKKKGRDHIIYGLIGLAVIVGMWGLVNIVSNTFGLSGNAPSVSGASSTCTLEGSPKLKDLLCYTTRIINNSIIPLIFSISVLMFVWGVVQYVINSSDEAKKDKGREFMLWGIIALAVMVSVWGLVSILGNTFGIDAGVIPQVKP